MNVGSVVGFLSGIQSDLTSSESAESVAYAGFVGNVGHLQR